MKKRSMLFMYKFVAVATAVVLGGGMLSNLVQAQNGPSFSCKSGLPPAEKAICGSAELSRYDRRMSSLYFELRNLLTNQSKRDLLADQRTWLADRKACGNSRRCLRGIYVERIDFLESILVQADAPQSTVSEQVEDEGNFVEEVPEEQDVQTTLNYPAAGMSLGLNLRSGPSKGFRNLGEIENGQPLIILDRARETNGRFAWYEVMDANGRRGFVWGGALCNFFNPADAAPCR